MPQNYVPVGPRELTCHECGTAYTAKSLSSRYCGRPCARKAQAKKPGEPCKQDGCSKKQRARGLCATHYNQTLPGRHKKIEKTCDCCGTTVLKEARSQRYDRTYCSDLCKNYHQWGPLHVELPPDHWALHISSTCIWTPPVAFNCGWCEKESFTRGNRDTYCSGSCRFRAKRARYRGRAFGAHGTYTWGQVARLWAMFDKACAYCSKPTALADIQAEHVTALSRGGANNIGNLLPSCMPCNADKRDLSLDEWKADRERRGLAPVTTHWSDNDTRYSHLTPMGHDLAA